MRLLFRWHKALRRRVRPRPFPLNVHRVRPAFRTHGLCDIDDLIGGLIAIQRPAPVRRPPVRLSLRPSRSPKAPRAHPVGCPGQNIDL